RHGWIQKELVPKGASVRNLGSIGSVRTPLVSSGWRGPPADSCAGGGAGEAGGEDGEAPVGQATGAPSALTTGPE
ncbi:MAG TPA: hypothetical protein VES97_06330, partial [Solirubrobacteraceae bacterium]|nr:hypothetical protein [Solirubrobacteraceae bacterium]